MQIKINSSGQWILLENSGWLKKNKMMFSRKQISEQIKYLALLAVALATLLLAVACGSAQTTDEALEATVPSLSSKPTEPIIIPTEAPIATDVSMIDDPQTNGLVAYIEQLEAAVSNQDYATMQTFMSNPLGVGAWRSEWRMVDPAQAIGQFQNGSLPAPLAVQFTGLTDEEVGGLIGQLPASMFGPGINVVAALHSTGWGQSTADEVILFVIEEDGLYQWSAFLYTSGSFAEPPNGAVSAPVGLIYRVMDDGVYQIQVDGKPHQLLDKAQASIPNLQISPDGQHAAYLTDGRQLWLINTTTGSQRQLAVDFNLSNFLMWGDNKTLFVGVWLNPEEGEGPNNGHIATLEINDEVLQILDEENLSGNRPALLSDYNQVAFDVFAPEISSRLYHPDSGLQIFDPADFVASNEMIQGPLFNPGWPEDSLRIAWLTSTGERFAVQLFDSEAKTATQLYDWDPARFGGLVPSPIWSPDGQWLALEILANGPEGSGVWVLAADGRSQTLVDGEGHGPHWVNDFQLVFNHDPEPRLYDVDSGEQFRLVLPENSTLVNVTDPEDMPALPSSIPAEDTPVKYVLALQNVTLYSGPGEEYEEIGGVFDGQTAQVTGQSVDGDWWRVICPDDTVGDCWVTADPAYTSPSNGVSQQAALPDPVTLELADETTVISPDGHWQAISRQSEPIVANDSEQFYASLTVTDGQTSWTPVAEWRGYGLGYTWPAVYQWSQDGRYLYYTNQGTPDGCSINSSITGLYRLSLADGDVVELLPGGRTLYFSLSPDESKIAYTTYNGQQEVFVLRNVTNGDEKSVVPIETAKRAQTAGVVWSADGREIVLVFAFDACALSKTSSIVHINRDTVSAKTLIEEDDRFFLIHDWPNPDQPKLRLVDKDGKLWQLNIDSGALVQET